MIEENIHCEELMKIYSQTPHSLGCATIITPELTEKLLNLGLSSGILLEASIDVRK